MKTDPDQNGTPNMIANNASLATLTVFQTGQLFGFPVKLLNFPSQGDTHLLYGLGRILSKIVGHDIVRALGRQHYSEQFHFMIFRKALDLDDFAVWFFLICPLQSIHTLIRLDSTRVIHLAVVFERAVIDLFQKLRYTTVGRLEKVDTSAFA